MNLQETTAIMSVLKAAYPRYYAGMTRQDAQSVLALWTEMFADDPAQLVAMAVKQLIATDTKGFPPHIGAVKAHIVRLQRPEGLTEQEAWACVSRALRNGLYGSQEEFGRLPEAVQRIVGSPAQLKEWAMMDMETVQSVVASNFQRSFRAREATDREMLATPADIKRAMAQLAEGLAMQALPEGGAE